MKHVLKPWQLLLIILAGRTNRHQHPQRGRVLGLLIEDVTLIKQSEIAAAIRFRGGATTTSASRIVFKMNEPLHCQVFVDPRSTSGLSSSEIQAHSRRWSMNRWLF
jgi:hypothetical protein